MKNYNVPVSSPVPDVDAIDDTFLGTTLPVSDLTGSVTEITIGLFIAEIIDGHKRGVGAAWLANSSTTYSSKITLPS